MSKPNFKETASSCDSCHGDADTALVKAGSYHLTRICEPCHDKWMINRILMWLHVCLFVSWVPLTQMIGDDIVTYFAGASDYLFGFQWGFAGTGLCMNAVMFKYRYNGTGYEL